MDFPEECGEFVRAWSAIESHGLDGWLRLARAEAGDWDLEPSEVMLESLEVFNGELWRLEHEADVKRYTARK